MSNFFKSFLMKKSTNLFLYFFGIQNLSKKAHTLLQTPFRIMKRNIIFLSCWMQRNWTNTVYLERVLPDFKKLVLTKWIGDSIFNLKKGTRQYQFHYFTKLLSVSHSTKIRTESGGRVIFAYRCM